MEFLVRGHLLLPGPSQQDDGMNGMEWNAVDVNVNGKIMIGCGAK
jgi:hypothetical protein